MYKPSESMCALINRRINEEEYSSRLYHSMHLWLEDKMYQGSAKLYQKFDHEELDHAQWGIDFLLKTGCCPAIQTIEAPPNEFESLNQIINLTLEHEYKISASCSDMMRIAFQTGDMFAFGLFQKYVNEQVEELGKANDLVKLAQLYNTDVHLLDIALGKLAKA